MVCEGDILDRFLRIEEPHVTAYLTKRNQGGGGRTEGLRLCDESVIFQGAKHRHVEKSAQKGQQLHLLSDGRHDYAIIWLETPSERDPVPP